jgi:hypothetical protein
LLKDIPTSLVTRTYSEENGSAFLEVNEALDQSWGEYITEPKWGNANAAFLIDRHVGNLEQKYRKWYKWNVANAKAVKEAHKDLVNRPEAIFSES